MKVLDILKRLVELEEAVAELKRWLSQSRRTAAIPRPVWEDTLPVPTSWEDTDLSPSAWTELFPLHTPKDSS
jgi:hypothetical protein